jgi:hypothetical protein
MLRSIASSESDGQTWGLRFDKEGLKIWFSFVALTTVLAFAYPPTRALPGHLTIISLTALSVVAQELVLRAFLINYLVSILGKSRRNVFLAVIATAFVIALVQRPFLQIVDGGTFGRLLGAGLLFGYACFYLRSIIVYVCFVVLALVGDLLPHAPDGEWVYSFGLTLLVCLILSCAGLLIKRHLSHASSAEPDLSVGG